MARSRPPLLRAREKSAHDRGTTVHTPGNDEIGRAPAECRSVSRQAAHPLLHFRVPDIDIDFFGFDQMADQFA